MHDNYLLTYLHVHLWSVQVTLWYFCRKGVLHSVTCCIVGRTSDRAGVYDCCRLGSQWQWTGMSVMWLAEYLSRPRWLDRDHSFPRNTEFWAEWQNLPVFAEFLCFHGILRNLVLAGNIRDKYGIFWSGSGRRTVCIHDFTTKYMTATRALTGGILKILSWAYLKYCLFIW